jgi:hypothetical protein
MKALRIAMMAACLLAGSLPGSAQQKTATPPTAPIKPWEYLVISFGKTGFSSPVLDPELKQTGQSKILFYSNAGIVTASEAVSVQRQMDSLGRFGWELVGVVGTIGGDQQMLFKRPYDAERSVKEADLIKAEGERLAEEKRKLLTALGTPKTTDMLVDLDAAERQSGIDAEAKLLAGDIQSYKDLPIKIATLEPSQDSDGQFKATVRVLVDGSTKLLHENKYRTSEARALAGQVTADILRASKLQKAKISPIFGTVQISVVITINYGGKETPVAYEFTGGDRPWSDGKQRHP